jgi:uncharacterized protein (AIM24 family)
VGRGERQARRLPSPPGRPEPIGTDRGRSEPAETTTSDTLVVSTGNLAAFADSIDDDIRAVGGLKKTLFGHEGLFMTHLRGPGKVLLQTLKRTAVQAAGRTR